ncbi:HAD family hydrolase [Amphibacillus sp. Q70]|uniref:HAD family hydrolase n=1 Tax=Amphibacillus sp. Q70 TaxID=3453416 RepID=UPI003F83A9EB
MEAVIFDVDDTLYDQLKPFQQAFEKNFLFKDIPIEELYVYSRKLSDQVFHLSESGQMGMQNMHIYRIKKAMTYFNKKISDEEAISFQNDYQQFQQKIQLIPDIKETLDFCLSKEVNMGIITNGPIEHQKKKIQQLELEKWIPKDNILISSEVGVAKPDVEIFRLAESIMDLDRNKTYYLGDSFENDIIGAKNAGWKAVWINRRNRENAHHSIEADHLINGDKSVLELVRSII